MTNITLKVLGKNITKETLNAALSKKNCVVEEVSGELCLRIESKKAGNFAQNSANNKQTSVNEVESYLKDKGIKVERRRYTKREDWNAPNLTAKHDQNQKDAHFQSRIDRETDKLVKEFLNATDMKKKDFTTKAFREYLYKNSDLLEENDP